MDYQPLENPVAATVSITDNTTERHTRKGVLFRPSQAGRRWLYRYAQENRRTVNDVLCEALQEYRKTHSKS